MSEPSSEDLTVADWTVLLRADLRRHWRCGVPIQVETYLEKHAIIRGNTEAVLDLIEEEARQREEHGETIQEAEWERRFPDLASLIRRRFALHKAWDEGLLQKTKKAVPPDPPPADGHETATLPPPAAPSDPEAATITPPPDPVAEKTDLDHLQPAGDEPVEVIPVAVAAAKRVLPRVPGYEILSELGRGGMGVVYKARQVGFNRLVALKMLLSGAHAAPDERERFLREAEAVARLKHPGIVDVYAFGEMDGCPYFSLEYMEGGSLADRLGGRPLPPREAAALTLALAQAAHHAHREGVIHRDLKPANVLLTADGLPKIADFGLAKQMQSQGRTQSGAVMGTPEYMAPEQAEGHSRRIGPPCDVYALGAVLYAMLTGRPPHRGATTLDTLLLVLSAQPAPPRDLNANIPADLEAICMKCLSKAPEDRYATARRLSEDLECFLKGEAPRYARPSGRWRLWNQAAWAATNTPLWSLIVAAALLTLFIPASGMYFTVIPIAAAVTTAFLNVRAKAGSLAIAGLTLMAAVVVVLLYFTMEGAGASLVEHPWLELGAGAIALAVCAPLVGLLLSKADRILCIALLAAAALTCVGVIVTHDLIALLLGLVVGFCFGAVVRVTSLVAKTPAGVALVGAFWAMQVTPCGCGPAGPLFMLFMLGTEAQQRPGMQSHSDLAASVGFSVVFVPVYLLFAIGGAALNAVIYRSSRRKLWQQSDYASTLRRGAEKTAESQK